MSPVSRWKRLISPHGVFQRAEIARRACRTRRRARSSSCSGVALRRHVVVRPSCPAVARLGADAPPELLAPEDRERRRHRRRRPAIVPAAQRGDLLGELRLQRIGGRQLRRTPSAAAASAASNAGEVAVERRGEQRVEREVLLVRRARGSRAGRAGSRRRCRRTRGIVRLLRAVRARRRPRPVVGVVEPAARRIQQVRASRRPTARRATRSPDRCRRPAWSSRTRCRASG